MPAHAHALAAARGAEDEHADGQQHRVDIGEIDWDNSARKRCSAMLTIPFADMIRWLDYGTVDEGGVT